jgi:hypothetical protein
MCQRASGAPFTGLFFVKGSNITITKGHPRTYRSSPQVDRYFCDRCGAPLFFQRLNRPEDRAIFVGSLDDPNHFKPDVQVCLSSAVGWLDIRDGAPRYQEKPEGMSPTLRYDPISGEATQH